MSSRATKVTGLAAGAVDGGLVAEGSALVGEMLGEVFTKRGSTTCTTFLDLTLEEGFNYKRIPRGHTSMPVFIAIFIFLKFENLHRLLTMINHLLLTRFYSS